MAKKILIMDDDPTIADLLTEALAEEGYESYMTTQSLRFYDAVHAGGRDGMAVRSFVNPILHLSDHFGDLHSVHAYAKNSEAGVALKGLCCLILRLHG